VTFTGQFPNMWSIIYLFKVNFNKSEYKNYWIIVR